MKYETLLKELIKTNAQTPERLECHLKELVESEREEAYKRGLEQGKAIARMIMA